MHHRIAPTVDCTLNKLPSVVYIKCGFLDAAARTYTKFTWGVRPEFRCFRKAIARSLARLGAAKNSCVFDANDFITNKLYNLKTHLYRHVTCCVISCVIM